MSESLLKNTEILGDLLLVWIIVFFVFIIASIVYSIIKAHYGKKRNGYAKAKINVRDRYFDKLNDLDNQLDTEVEGQVEYKEKLKEQKDAEIDSLNTLEEKYDKLYRKCDNIMTNISTVLCVVFIGTLFLIWIACSTIGGSFSDIKRIDNVTTENIEAKAYYVIDYEGVQQKTITVFVKNNSDKTLYNANIVETNSGVSQDILTLDPNEEKIVSFNVYSNDGSDYEFKIENVEFKE